MKRKFIGSTVALILGTISFLAAIAQTANGNASNPLAGEIMILGALAYKSLKKRKLGIVKQSGARQTYELALIALIILLVALQNDLKSQIAIYPFQNIIIPLWALIAYAVLFFKNTMIESTLSIEETNNE